jgi:DNA-binding transcriptional LysR family regulator
MSLAGLDLNLLVALHALLEERHVTNAAQRIGLSQPSASAMLARLRRHFGDELLVRVGNRYELTPLAVTLRGHAATAVEVVERTFTTRADFDPASTDREFTLLVSDYAVAVLGEALLRCFTDAAPRARLLLRRIGMPDPRGQELDMALRAVDGVLAPHGLAVSGYPALDLFHDEWVCIAAASNAAVGERISPRLASELPWVVAHYDTSDGGTVIRRLTELGIRPHVDAVIDNFQLVPYLITGSPRIAVVQRRLVHTLCARDDIRVLPCPFDTEPIVEALWWHPAHSHDAGHSWLRQVIGRAAARVA